MVAKTIGVMLMVVTTGVAMANVQNALSEEERAAGWQLLFDGESLDAWRTYQREALSDGWQARDGAIVRTGRAGDMITREQFGNFELSLEARVEAGGNSGIFIRAGEAERFIFMTAPEVQILDDAGHRDGGSPLTSAGSNYGLHPAPRGVARGAGEWNHFRIRVQDDLVTQWLNDQQIVQYRLGSDDWRARVADSKFSAWPAYGTLARGHIGLQDHGDPVAFRNLKIRVLDDAP